MKFRKSAIMASAALVLFGAQFIPTVAFAQHRGFGSGPGAAPVIGGIFGGLLAAGIAQGALAGWQSLPQSEAACVNAALQTRGGSIQQLAQGGIGPQDPRVAPLRQTCANLAHIKLKQNFPCTMTVGGRQFTSWCNQELARTSQGHWFKLTMPEAVAFASQGQQIQVNGFERLDAENRRKEMMIANPISIAVNAPSFDCSKAKTKAEQMICWSYDISVLDDLYASYYRQAKPLDSQRVALKEVVSVQKKMQSCQSPDCVRQSLTEGKSFLAGFLAQNGITVDSFPIVQQVAPSSSGSLDQVAAAAARPAFPTSSTPVASANSPAVAQTPSLFAGGVNTGSSKYSAAGLKLGMTEPEASAIAGVASQEGNEKEYTRSYRISGLRVKVKFIHHKIACVEVYLPEFSGVNNPLGRQLAEKFVTEWGKPVIPMSQCQDTCVVYLPNDFNETCDRRNYDFGCAMKSGFAYVTGMDFLSYEAKPEIILQDINAVESKKQEDAVAYQNKVREERNDALNKSLMR